MKFYEKKRGGGGGGGGGGRDGGIQEVVRPIMNGWVENSAHYDDFS